MGKATQAAAGKKPGRTLSPEQMEKARLRAKAWYLANRERALATCKKNREANIEAIREYDRNRPRRKRNPEKARASQRRYRKLHGDKHREYMREWRRANREKVLTSKKKWYENNKEKHMKCCLGVNRRRAAVDMNYKLRSILRARLYKLVSGETRVGSAVRDLGCSVEHLRMHIEGQFREGWSWENWGTAWHLDHIYPLAAANLGDRVEFLAVNNWQNLRPLCAVENVAKKDAVTDEARHLFASLVAKFAAQQVA